MAKGFADRFDWGIVGASLVLISMGLLVLASGNTELFFKQLLWFSVGLILMFGLPLLNVRAFFTYRWAILGIYFFVLLFLIITAFFAPEINGTRSWLVFGPVQIQASEFMKIALIILFSSFFAARHVAIARVGIIIASFVYFLIPAILVLIQPDLGTSLILFGIWFGYLLISGLPIRYIISSILIFILVGVAAWGFGLADYQKARIIGLFQPNADPLGVNYSVAQSKIAIGSGGFLGKGFGQGTQVHSGFLPAAQTDFIFSSFVEEWGILGGIFMIATFLFLVYRILRIGMRSNSNFSRFVALGSSIFLFLHFSVNLGSALGILPVIGVGLPLVSYGGSNLLTTTALVGIIQGVAEKR